jgi:hypothetical protein
MEVMTLNAALKLIDEVSPTVENIESSLNDLEKALGVTRAEVERNRKAQEELARTGKMTEYAVEKLGITMEEYLHIIANQQAQVKFAKEMEAMHQEALKINESMGKSQQQLTSFGIAIAGQITAKVTQAAGSIINFVKESVTLAMRLEMVTGVSRMLGEQNGISAEKVDELTEKLKKQGITSIESRQALIKMTQAGLDMNKSVDLARVAQNAARIGNVNSSEALGRLIHGITTMQSETLRGLGIIVKSDQAQQVYARSLGKTAKELSGTERQQAMYNAVLKEGEKIAGVYSETLEYGAGKEKSLDRYREEAQIKIGEQFAKIKGIMIEFEGYFWKYVQKFPEAATVIGAAIAAIGTTIGIGMGSWAKGLDVVLGRTKQVNDLLTATGKSALDAATSLKSLGSGKGWGDLLTSLKGIASEMKNIGSMDMSSLSKLAGGGVMGWAAVAVGAVAATAAVYEVANALGNAAEAHVRATDSGLSFAKMNENLGTRVGDLKSKYEDLKTALEEKKKSLAEATTSFEKHKFAITSTDEAEVKHAQLIYETNKARLDAISVEQKQIDQAKTTRANLEEATSKVGMFSMAWQVTKDVFEALSSNFEKMPIWLQAILLPIKLVVDALQLLGMTIAALRNAAEWLAGFMFETAKSSEELTTQTRNEAVVMKEAEKIAKERGITVKTYAEALKLVSTAQKENADKVAKANEDIEKQKKAHEDLAGSYVDRIRTETGYYDKMLEKEEKEAKLKEKAASMTKKLGREITVEMVRQREEQAKQEKASEAAGKKAATVLEAHKKKVQELREEYTQTGGKIQDQVTLIAEALSGVSMKSLSLEEYQKLGKSLDDLRDKGGKLSPALAKIADDFKAVELANKNTKEQMDMFLADLNKLGPTTEAVSKQFQAMQTAMNVKVDLEGGLMNLNDEAIKAYVAEMSKLQESGKLTAEQYAAMGPIFEEAFKRGIIGADELAVRTGNATQKAVDAMRQFGPTVNDIADKFTKLQKGIQDYGGISNMLKVNPEAGKAAVKALEDIGKSTLLATEDQKLLKDQMALAEQQGVKSAAKIAHEQVVAANSTRRWAQGMQGLIAVFSTFGGTAGEALAGVAQIAGNTQAAFASVSKAQSDYADKLKNLEGYKGSQAAKDDEAAIKQEKFNAKLNAGADAAGLLGGMMTKSSSATMQQAGAALQGAAAGAKMGASFGPIGAAVGAAAGAAFGWISAGKKMKAEVKKMYEEFEKANGGLEEMSKKAKEAGVSLEDVMKNKGTKNVEKMKKAIEEATAKMEAFDDLIQSVGVKDMAGLKAAANEAGVSLQKLFDAKSVEEYKAAAKQVKEEMALWGEAQDALTGAMDKYGITVDQLGGKFKQAGFDKMGVALLKDFEILKAAGVDVSVITEKMSEDMSDYVNRAVAAGTTIPLAMKPMVQQMIDTGNLLDENGKAIGSMEESGISFAQTLEEGIQSAVTAIEKLVEVLSKGFNIPVEVNGKPANGAGAGAGSGSGGSGSGSGSGGGGGGGGNNTAADHRATKNAVDEVAGAVGNLHDQYASAGEAAKAAAKDAMDVVKAEHGGAIKAIVAGSTAAKDAQKTWATESVSTFKTVADSASTAYKTAFDAAKNGGASLRDAMKAGTDAAVTASQDFANSNLAAAQSSVAAYGSAAEAGKAAFKASIDAAKAAGEKINMFSKEGRENYVEAKNAAAAAAAAWTGAQESIAAQAIVTSAAITVPIEAGAAVATDAAAVMSEQSSASFMEIQDATLALADSMSQDVPAAADIAYTAIQRIRDAAAEPINVNVTGNNQDDGLPEDGGHAEGMTSFRDFGRGTRTTLHGVEAVVRPEQVADLARNTGTGGNVSTVVNLAISENPMQTAETVEQMRAFTLETVQREISRSLADAIEGGRA